MLFCKQRSGLVSLDFFPALEILTAPQVSAASYSPLLQVSGHILNNIPLEAPYKGPGAPKELESQ